jgi:hypothetical protein
MNGFIPGNGFFAVIPRTISLSCAADNASHLLPAIFYRGIGRKNSWRPHEFRTEHECRAVIHDPPRIHEGGILSECAAALDSKARVIARRAGSSAVSADRQRSASSFQRDRRDHDRFHVERRRAGGRRSHRGLECAQERDGSRAPESMDNPGSALSSLPQCGNVVRREPQSQPIPGPRRSPSTFLH